MPNDNIKRTLDKYSGANGQVNYEANNYEATAWAASPLLWKR